MDFCFTFKEHFQYLIKILFLHTVLLENSLPSVILGD